MTASLEWPDEADEEPELGPTPRQEPKLTALEAMLARARDTRQARIEWLMAPESPEMQSLLDLFERPAWHQWAACRGVGPAFFFPERGDGRPFAALAICKDCSVRSQCLEAALEVPSMTGVWAGTTQQGRRAMRRGVVA